MALDIIFLMIAAVFVITRLYAVFGTRGDEKDIHIVNEPVDKKQQINTVENLSRITADSSQKIVDIQSLNDNTIHKNTDNNFNKEAFIRSARMVFEMILHAFNSGNMVEVKDLVSKKIYDAFNEVLTFRKENKMSAEVDFICFEKSEIKEIKTLKDSIKVVVEFVSEQINILKNADGEVIEGDENFVQKITDVWTFERSLNAKHNHWVLVSTKKSC